MRNTTNNEINNLPLFTHPRIKDLYLKLQALKQFLEKFKVELSNDPNFIIGMDEEDNISPRLEQSLELITQVDKEPTPDRIFLALNYIFCSFANLHQHPKIKKKYFRSFTETFALVNKNTDDFNQHIIAVSVWFLEAAEITKINPKTLDIKPGDTVRKLQQEINIVEREITETQTKIAAEKESNRQHTQLKKNIQALEERLEKKQDFKLLSEPRRFSPIIRTEKKAAENSPGTDPNSDKTVDSADEKTVTTSTIKLTIAALNKQLCNAIQNILNTKKYGSHRHYQFWNNFQQRLSKQPNISVQVELRNFLNNQNKFLNSFLSTEISQEIAKQLGQEDGNLLIWLDSIYTVSEFTTIDDTTTKISLHTLRQKLEFQKQELKTNKKALDTTRQSAPSDEDSENLVKKYNALERRLNKITICQHITNELQTPQTPQLTETIKNAIKILNESEKFQENTILSEMTQQKLQQKWTESRKQLSEKLQKLLHEKCNQKINGLKNIGKPTLDNALRFVKNKTDLEEFTTQIPPAFTEIKNTAENALQTASTQWQEFTTTKLNGVITTTLTKEKLTAAEWNDLVKVVGILLQCELSGDKQKPIELLKSHLTLEKQPETPAQPRFEKILNQSYENFPLGTRHAYTHISIFIEALHSLEARLDSIRGIKSLTIDFEQLMTKHEEYHQSLLKCVTENNTKTQSKFSEGDINTQITLLNNSIQLLKSISKKVKENRLPRYQAAWKTLETVQRNWVNTGHPQLLKNYAIGLEKYLDKWIAKLEALKPTLSKNTTAFEIIGSALESFHDYKKECTELKNAPDLSTKLQQLETLRGAVSQTAKSNFSDANKSTSDGGLIHHSLYGIAIKIVRFVGWLVTFSCHFRDSTSRFTLTHKLLGECSNGISIFGTLPKKDSHTKPESFPAATPMEMK